MSQPVIILFTRIPRLGQGKRRLASTLGERAALRFSRLMLGRALWTVGRLRGAERILATTPDHHARYRARGFKRVGQGQGDLGVRMQRVFWRYPNRPVVIIGSDIPDIAAGDLILALRKLRGADAVFGPALDGGYWLIGLAGRRPATPFANVRWSSPDTLTDTLDNFRGHRVAFLRTLYDIDEMPMPVSQRENLPR